MKMHSISGLALLALFAFGAIFASTAGAEEVTLLAEWLITGSPITTLTSVETEVKAVFKDIKVPIAGEAGVTCEFLLVGSVGSNGEGEITSMLDLSLTPLGLGWTELICPLKINCEEAGKVVPINLPWHMLLELVVATPELFINLTVEGENKTLPGYEVTCKIFGITQVDSCTMPNHAGGMVGNGGTDVLLTAELILPRGNCSIGGAGSASVEIEEGLSYLLSGTLQVSSA